MRLALIAGRSTSTSKALTQALIDGAVWEELTPHEALDVLRPGDGALGLPRRDGSWVVVELNGAVEFTSDYSTWFDVFAEVALLLQDELVDRRARPEWQPAAPEVSSSSRSRG